MEYLCSECSTQLSKFEIELNELYPVGKLYCEFCQNKHEREIIKELADSLSDLSFYDFDKQKKEE
jgi:DNA-directed RNA polymerase subunit RPC12/RpoP